MPTLFALFINDLVNDLNSLGYGIQVGTYKINVLLYADDIVILAENETILQKLLDKLYRALNGSWKLTHQNLKLFTFGKIGNLNHKLVSHLEI